jgi:hypothetical protein
MVTEEQNSLIESLTESFTAVHAILEGIDLEMRVYTDSDWQIRDIIGHIATWDLQTSKSIRAFIEGTEYSIPNLDEGNFNQAAVIEQRKLTSQQVIDEWALARRNFKDAVQGVPPDRYPGEMLYPWGSERGSIPRLVKTMVEHDIEHKTEILKAIQANTKE